METGLDHWQNIYAHKGPNEVGWTQLVPAASLELITEISSDKTLSIIDVGGGDSRLVDHLLDLGYVNLTVLDISSLALDKAKRRLGGRAGMVQWICMDILNFKPEVNYDIWHDRACFHFLLEEEKRNKYLQIAENHTNHALVMGTFSEQGPTKCSGLAIVQYTPESLAYLWSRSFIKKRCLQYDHITPFSTKQNYTFCSFNKRTR